MQASKQAVEKRHIHHMKVREVMVNPVIVQDVPSFLHEIYKIEATSDHVMFFRGQPDVDWNITPSVLRDEKARKEDQIFNRMLCEFPHEFSKDQLAFQKLARGQHYSFPTRLLDVSLNPLISLYFACDQKEDRDGSVFCFQIPSIDVKFFDSDTVSILSNFCRLTYEQKHEVRRIAQLKSVNSDEIEEISRATREFQSNIDVSSLLHFIKSEKPYFEPRINPADLLRILLVIPEKSNGRITRQSGAFLLSGNDTDIFQVECPTLLKRMFAIPPKNKGTILNQLNKININPVSILCDMPSAAKYLDF